MTHRDRAGDPPGRREAAGDAGHRQGFPTPSGGSPARPEAAYQGVREAWRKAEVVAAVRAGRIGLDEACTRYGITLEEFLSWQRLLDEPGLHGLARHARAGLSATGPGRGRCRRAAGRWGRVGTSDA